MSLPKRALCLCGFCLLSTECLQTICSLEKTVNICLGFFPLFLRDKTCVLFHFCMCIHCEKHFLTGKVEWKNITLWGRLVLCVLQHHSAFPKHPHPHRITQWHLCLSPLCLQGVGTPGKAPWDLGSPVCNAEVTAGTADLWGTSGV